MKDKQIEDMAKIICLPTANKGNCEKCGFKKHCSKFDDATDLYNAGYRKASDVAREIIEFIEDCLNRLIDIAAPSKSIANFIKIIKWHLCIKIEKKYESEGEG